MLKPRLVIFALLAFLIAPFDAGAMSSSGSGPMIPEFKDGMMAANTKDYVAAEVKLKEAVEKLPTHVDSWSLLGFVSRKLGKVDDAFKYYEKALSLDKEFRPALNYMGHLFLETGQIDQAKGMLSRLDSACFFGCPEYDDLKEAVAAGKSGKY